MDSNATTVLLFGFGPMGSPALMITGGLGTGPDEPGGGGSSFMLLGVS